MHCKQKKWIFFCAIFLKFSLVFSSNVSSIFKVTWLLGETSFPTNVGLNDPPIKHTLTITNTSTSDMSSMTYTLPNAYILDKENTSCSTKLKKTSPCQLSLIFNPNQVGHYAGKLKVCGGKGNWCSQFPISFDITVTANQIVSTNCNAIKSRPFSTEDCKTSYQYAQNFEKFLVRVLRNFSATPKINQFSFFQHTPSINETTVNCINATQPGVGLDTAILGGGTPLCSLMSLATANASLTENSGDGKLFPHYLTFLLGTPYPITSTTIPLFDLTAMQNEFATTTSDDLVRNLGYLGYVDFLNSYYIDQLEPSRAYSSCGTSGATCPSIFYVPFKWTQPTNQLESWPPPISYWGISGGGGSGAGYQIQAFQPGNPKHYTLFTGGGGGGGGTTTPEGTSQPLPTLINTGSGGGGGSQFANCYMTQGNQNLNGLGLGAGTGAGLSTVMNAPVTFQPPPTVSYSYYPPTSQPSWISSEILTKYADNLDYLIGTLLPLLYSEGYVITVTGGGGGGAGLEFINAAGNEFQPHPVSIGYGFNFCYAFQKNGEVDPKTDCLSSTTNIPGNGQTLDSIIYQNVGNFYNQGMELAILPENCPGGYSNFTCTCAFQHAYVICQLENVLVANGFTSADIPTWLINPHCNDSLSELITQANAIDSFLLTSNSATANCSKALQNFYTAKSTVCTPSWVL